MGQLYDVELRLLYADKRELVSALDKRLETLPSDGTKASKVSLDECDIYNRLLRVTGGNQALYTSIYESPRVCLFTAGFHATYSWESILWNLMDALAPALEDYSYIKVCPDVGCWKRTIKDHQVLGTEDEDLERIKR